MQQQSIPYSKLLRIAVITSPLFGILGAVPAFAMVKTEPGRVVNSFIVVMLITSIIWSINLLFLSVFSGRDFKGRNLFRYMLTVFTGVIIGLLIFYWFFHNQQPPRFINGVALNRPAGFPFNDNLFRRLTMPGIQVVSIGIIILILSELIILKERKLDIERENDRLRLTNLEARHNQLKQQLHPHFLFNSLNTLKSLIKREPEHAESYLIKLSELLRFSLYANKEEVVPVEKELELCINYLHMQEVRFGNALSFSISIPDEIKSTGILPVYSIQLLAENAIKHNSLSAAQPLHILITGNPAENSITVMNNLQPKLSVEDGSGVGLSNLAERYRLLGNAGIDIHSGFGEFAVTIKVLQHERSNY